jgi:hypothetical protein
MTIDRMVAYMLRGAAAASLVAASIVLAVPAFYRDGVALAGSSYLADKYEIQTDSDGNLLDSRRWQKIAYLLEIRSPLGSSIAVVPSERLVTLPTPVKYLGVMPRIFVFASDYSYWPHAVFGACLAALSLVLAREAKRVATKNLRTSGNGRNADPAPQSRFPPMPRPPSPSSGRSANWPRESV